MEPSTGPILLRKPWTERRLLKWLFLVVTVIATIQFLQYYIFYNSSYPFPYLQNITASYGSFYTYFLFVPIIFRMAKLASNRLNALWQMILFHLVIGAILSMLHLLIIHFLGWLQVYKWDNTPFFMSYRFLLSKWLHFEILIYGFVVFMWRALDYVRWNQLKKTEETGETEALSDQYLTRIRVKDGHDINFISVEQIRWIEAYDNYIKIRVNGRFYLIRKTLSSIEKELNPESFQRIHRSQIVAMREVENLRIDSGNYQVILKDQTPLKLSRTYKEVIEARLKG